MAKTSLFLKLTAKPGRRDDVLAALDRALPAARDEAGTEVYSFHRDKGDAEVVWVFELYADDDAVASHGASEAVTTLFAEVGDLLAEPPTMAFAEPHAAKGLDV